MKYFSTLIVIVLVSTSAVFAQSSSSQQDSVAYTKVLNERVSKLLSKIDISDEATQSRTQQIIVDQYKILNAIHNKLDADMKVVKNNKALNGEEKDKAIAALKNEADAQLYQQHCVFIGQLNGDLNAKQIDEVKDGMTYGTVDVTYSAYCDMLPNLKEGDKRQLRIWLVEAREHAMDASSSKEKHAWFGKYKGRYNNYLSKQGYDVQTARAAWTKRLQAEQKAK